MKRKQRGDAGVLMLVMMAVLMGVWFWKGDRMHGRNQHADGSGIVQQEQDNDVQPDSVDTALPRNQLDLEKVCPKRLDLSLPGPGQPRAQDREPCHAVLLDCNKSTPSCVSTL